MKKGKYEANDVARFFLYKVDEMTQKKLHKMLFFAYAWYLYENNDEGNIENRLFTPKNPQYGFQAWVHGPVYRELYPVYANFGFKPINVLEFDESIFDDDDLNLLNQIVDVYGKMSAYELEEETHKYYSWQNARKGYGPYEACKVLLDDNDIYHDIELI